MHQSRHNQAIWCCEVGLVGRVRFSYHKISNDLETLTGTANGSDQVPLFHLDD